MVTIAFLALLALSCMVALADWRRGWFLAFLCGVLQDPARKMTPGTPVILTMSILAVYAMVLFASQRTLQLRYRDLTKRYGLLNQTLGIVLLFLILAAVRGATTFGLAFWTVPALSLFIYLAPLPAVLLGYTWATDEASIVRFLQFFAAVSTVMLVGVPLEYFHSTLPGLGLVGTSEAFIRHRPGIQIRTLSGFYRAPDIMGWHAAMLTAAGLTLVMRGKTIARAWPWILVSAWGFLCALISGRRKAVYMIAVFIIVFVVRYFRRLTTAQLFAFAASLLMMVLVVRNVSSSEASGVYTRGALAQQGELSQRLEGGMFETIQQFGIFGAGLGTATQGVRHLLGRDDNIGWQEGGLGKLTMELGVPGLIAAIVFAFVLGRFLLRISGAPDEPETSQVIRTGLFAITAANVANFLASAQAYSDATLTLTTAFLLGCLLATARFADDRRSEREAATVAAGTPRAVPA